MSTKATDHQIDLIETRAAITTAWQDLRELAARHKNLADDPVFAVLDAALERLALPGVTSVAALSALKRGRAA